MKWDSCLSQLKGILTGNALNLLLNIWQILLTAKPERLAHKLSARPDIEPSVVFMLARRYQHDCPLHTSSALHITAATDRTTHKGLLRIHFENTRTVFVECSFVGIANYVLCVIQYAC